jgi:biotin transporter BioY
VAIRVEPTIAVGFLLPLIAKMLMAVAGTNWMELVLSAKKVHIAFVATPFFGFKSFRCAIAFNPSGVAALLTPSMFAAMFIIIAPIAGWFAGISGKSRDMIGRIKRPSS